ncbi:MAG: Arc family DNA-binding protein [Alphaproteobacteria bacterium]
MIKPVPINISIKNAPDDLIERVRERARRNHRSLQGEVLAILEKEVGSGPKKTPQEILEEVRKLGLKTPSESVAMIREDRDSR